MTHVGLERQHLLHVHLETVLAQQGLQVGGGKASIKGNFSGASRRAIRDQGRGMIILALRAVKTMIVLEETIKVEVQDDIVPRL